MQLEKLNKNLRNRDVVPVLLTFVAVMIVTASAVGAVIRHPIGRPAGINAER